MKSWAGSILVLILVWLVFWVYFLNQNEHNKPMHAPTWVYLLYTKKMWIFISGLDLENDPWTLIYVITTNFPGPSTSINVTIPSDE